MSKPAARIGDNHVCPMVNPGPAAVPHVGGPIMGPGVPTVLICGQPAAVLGDTCTCTGPPDKVVLGSSGVLIGGKPAARMGDMCAHGGSIVSGAPTVLIGEVSPGPSTPPAVVAQLLNKLEKVVIGSAGASPVMATAMAMVRAEAALIQAAQNGDRFADPAAFAPEVAPPPPTPCEQVAAMGDMEPKDRIQALQALEADLRPSQPELAEQLAKDQGVIEKAYLSNAVYSPEKASHADIGYSVVTDEERAELGLPPASKCPDQQLYAKGDPPKYVLSMRGTDELKDWKTNAKQALGFKDTSYNEAIANARQLRSKGVDVELTGHSKGGGMAAAAASAAGLPATTFNAAGVHDQTLLEAGLTEEQIAGTAKNVEAYHNEKDPLNLIQDNRKLILATGASAGAFGGPIGPLISAALGFVLQSGGLPKAFGQRTTVPAHSGQGMNPLKNHGMDAMMKSIAEQQDNRLNQQLGCTSPAALSA